MKTQIIQLEEHDDIISTRDKLGWGQTSRIILVWPSQANILTQPLELVLLQRYSLSLGKHIALVVQNPLVRSLGKELGIPVFNSLREAQSSRWRTTHRRKSRITRRQPRPDLQAMAETSHPPVEWMQQTPVRISMFVLSLVAILLVVVALVPSALIEITPAVQNQEMLLEATAYLEGDVENQPDGLPAFPTTLIVEGREVLTTTGTTPVPVQPATGSVRFTNLTGQPVNVPEGSIVSTLGANPIRFTTQRDGWVPAGVGTGLQLPVMALAPGSEGNVPMGAIQAIDGPLGLRLSVNNPTRTSGGKDYQVPAPTLKDQQQLFDLLSAKLMNTAQSELLSQYAILQPGNSQSGDGQSKGTPPSTLPILPSLKFLNVIEETYNPPDLQPASQLELTLRLEFQAWFIPGQALENLASTALDSALPPGYQAVPGSLEIELTSRPVLDESGQVRWKMSVNRQLQAMVSPGEVADLAAGARSAYAAAYLVGKLPLQKPPVIQQNIPWWPYLPFLPLRVQVVCVDSDQ
jgi:hypothetical protein